MKVRMKGFDMRNLFTKETTVEIPSGFFVDDMVDIEGIEKILGKALRDTLKESSYILIRTIT